MDAEAQELWIRFQELALSTWRQTGSGVSRAGYQTDELFTIRVLPSFGDPVSWSVARQSSTTPDSVSYVGMRREWNRTVDLAHFETPLSLLAYKHRGRANPTYSHLRLELDPEAFAPLQRVINEDRIALAIDRGAIGCDGVTTELELGDTWAGLTVAWWGDGPASWKRLTSVVNFTFDMLERIYQTHSDAG